MYLYELSRVRQELRVRSSAVNVTNTSYMNKDIFPSQMIVEIRVEQILRGTRPNEHLPVHEILILQPVRFW
jgi:hypothetical protein